MIFFVVGLPGSGKTTWAKTLDPELFTLIDDPTEKLELCSEFNWVITDPQLCYVENWMAAKKMFPDSQWVFFEPDFETCWKNLERRNKVEPWKQVSRDYLKVIHRNYSKSFDRMVTESSTLVVKMCYSG
jgi:hypothetical protein